MENLVIIKSMAAELEAGNPAGAADYFADNFIYRGPSEYLEKGQFIALLKAIKEAFPDWSWGFNAIACKSHGIKMLMMPHGTHTNEFALPGIQAVPPTGTEVLLSPELVEYEIEDDKITQMRVETASGSGLLSLLPALGIEISRFLHDKLGFRRRGAA